MPNDNRNSATALIGRREVIAAGAASVLTVKAGAASVRGPKKSFVWGVAASSAQTESRQGRGRSNWDVFADTPGKIADGSTNARCTEFDLRYIQDLDLLKAAGVRAFRFSTAWPRIQPDGPGKPSQAGLDLYSRMVDAMLARNIDPWITLFHWDVPVWAGDFRHRDITSRMADYAGHVVARLGDRVKHWIALNEPNTVALVGYAEGRHAPGLMGAGDMLAAIHHQNLAIGLVTQAARAQAGSRSMVGTTQNVLPVRPASNSAEDRMAAGKLDMLWNKAFMDPLFGRGYPTALVGALESLIKTGDLETIATKPDFLGVNYYARAYVKASKNPGGFELAASPADLPQTAIFPVEPDGLTEALTGIRDTYGEIPLYVTETGFALADGSDWASRIRDVKRSDYLDRYLAAAARARASGVNLRGLFYWAATDNWEWAEGFAKRFGLIAVDSTTQKRGVKQSLTRYAGTIQRHFPDAI